MKSEVHQLLSVAEGILSDASNIWPESTDSFGLDLIRLRKSSKHRGKAFILSTLPDYGKFLDRSLAESHLLMEEIPKGINTIRNRPELFGDLFNKVFGDSGTLLSDPDINAVFFIRQLCYFAKKFKEDYDQDVLENNVNEFYNTDQELPRPSSRSWLNPEPEWGEIRGHPILTDRHEEDRDLFDHRASSSVHLPWDSLRLLSRRVISSLGSVPWWDLRPQHGPGATCDHRGNKYAFPQWPRKLGSWFPYDWFGSGILTGPEPSDREPPSKLIAVPKHYQKPRLICAEPSAHQWMQQAIRKWLEESMARTVLARSIDFRSQQNSRDGALAASLDGARTTVDLSSASDRLSCHLVEYIFQGHEILNGFHAVRTQMVSQDFVSDGTVPRTFLINKFSTQGSALTFPVQSIVFAILSVWALRLSEGRHNDYSDLESDFRRVTVFGDDIILPTTAYPVQKAVFQSVGLVISTNKTFSRGFFRESCGMDAFKGYDVTPAYLTRASTTTQEATGSMLDVSNNFFKKGLFETAKIIERMIPPNQLKLIPVVSSTSGSRGLLSFVGNKVNHLKSRYNRDLQRIEYRVLSFSSRVTKDPGTELARLTQSYFEQPPLYAGKEYKFGTVSRVVPRKGTTWVPE